MSSQTQARVGSPTSASRSSEARHVHTDAFGFHGRGAQLPENSKAGLPRLYHLRLPAKCLQLQGSHLPRLKSSVLSSSLCSMVCSVPFG